MILEYSRWPPTEEPVEVGSFALSSSSPSPSQTAARARAQHDRVSLPQPDAPCHGVLRIAPFAVKASAWGSLAHNQGGMCDGSRLASVGCSARAHRAVHPLTPVPDGQVTQQADSPCCERTVSQLLQFSSKRGQLTTLTLAIELLLLIRTRDPCLRVLDASLC